MLGGEVLWEECNPDLEQTCSFVSTVCVSSGGAGRGGRGQPPGHALTIISVRSIKVMDPLSEKDMLSQEAR